MAEGYDLFFPLKFKLNILRRLRKINPKVKTKLEEISKGVRDLERGSSTMGTYRQRQNKACTGNQKSAIAAQATVCFSCSLLIRGLREEKKCRRPFLCAAIYLSALLLCLRTVCAHADAIGRRSE